LDSQSRYIENPSDEEEKLSLDDVMKRYRYYFDKEKPEDNKSEVKPEDKGKKFDVGSLHTYIDVCDNIGHSGGIDFNDQGEAQIIEHIEKCHKAELIGIMSLYPKEWKYRMDASYNDICGKNIAIDTDDLVLTNQNLSLVIGTYGKRGSSDDAKIESIDWKKHLKRRDLYHVCWPEYLILIELILAKKQTINYTIARYIQKSKYLSKLNTRKQIENNAKLSIQLSNSILELDSIRYLRYVSHKHMFKQVEQNMGIPEDMHYLNDTIKRIDNSLNNASNSMEIEQAEKSGNILFFISIASLFGAALQIIVSSVLSEKGIWLRLTVSILTLMVIIGLLLYILSYRKKTKHDC
jgi:VIT1/CCC1 family predicted Fe2+/Mn2+ transporter